MGIRKRIRAWRTPICAAVIAAVLGYADPASAETVTVRCTPGTNTCTVTEPTVITTQPACGAACASAFANALSALAAPRKRGLSFFGYPCDGGSCAEHEAGWDFARARDITDSAACPNPAREFREGCWAATGKYARSR